MLSDNDVMAKRYDVPANRHSVERAPWHRAATEAGARSDSERGSRTARSNRSAADVVVADGGDTRWH